MAENSVLIIEDTEELADIFCHVFELRGLHTSVARDGHEAMSRIEGKPPNAVILDLNIPYVSGLELLTTMRNTPLWQDTRIIVVTADTIGSQDAEGLADLVLLKPVTLDQLLTLVDRFMS